MAAESKNEYKDKTDPKVADLYYSLNFDLIKVSDSKASTLILISGQSILIIAFLLANIIKLENAAPIAVGFAISVIFNAVVIFLAIAALIPRTFQETSTFIQPLYAQITRYTKDQFINEFLKLQSFSKEESNRHYAEVIYQISTILRKKMRYIQISARLFFIGIGVLIISIFILVFQILMG